MIPIPSRIRPLPPAGDEEEDPVDIFASSLSAGTLFPDHPITSHGDPGGRVVYSSPRFGDVILDIPVHPDEEGGRGLFAHYLWSAAAVTAAGVEWGSGDERAGDGWWDVRGTSVLEVGAGTALPSLVAAASSARSVHVTDHPSSPALTAGSIVANVQRNLFPADGPRTSARVRVVPHVWGRVDAAAAWRSSFDKILVADCLWMGSQHDALVSSLTHFLRPLGDRRRSAPCALVVAGFHTGRPVLASFFSKVAGRGLTIEEIWEIDIGAPTRDPRSASDGIPGLRRPWTPVREGESREDAARWCVVAVVTKPGGPHAGGDGPDVGDQRFVVEEGGWI